MEITLGIKEWFKTEKKQDQHRTETSMSSILGRTSERRSSGQDVETATSVMFPAVRIAGLQSYRCQPRVIVTTGCP